jgi:hypothetical protein
VTLISSSSDNSHGQRGPEDIRLNASIRYTGVSERQEHQEQPIIPTKKGCPQKNGRANEFPKAVVVTRGSTW